MRHVHVCGITPVEAYSECISIKDSKQCIEKLRLCIPRVKPDVEYIEELQISAEVEEIKKIDSILGKKLVVQGKIFVKIIYTADNLVQSLHSSHWEKEFSEYILLENEDKHYGSVKRVFPGVEDISIVDVDARMIKISIILILCPEMSPYKRHNGR